MQSWDILYHFSKFFRVFTKTFQMIKKLSDFFISNFRLSDRDIGQIPFYSLIYILNYLLHKNGSEIKTELLVFVGVSPRADPRNINS
jgi:hypothetical protein